MRYRFYLLLPLVLMAGCKGSNDDTAASQAPAQSTFGGQAELDQANKTIEDLTSQRDIFASQNQSLVTTTQTLTTERDAALSARDLALSARDQTNKDIQGYLDKIAADDAALATSNSQLQDLQAKLAAAPTQAEKDDLTAQIAEINGQIATLTADRDAQAAAKTQAIADRDAANTKLLELAKNVCVKP